MDKTPNNSGIPGLIEWPTDLLSLIVEKTAEGMWVAFLLFTQKNRIPTSPTKDCEDVLGECMLRLTAELSDGNNSYPFGEDSLNGSLEDVVEEYKEGIWELWVNGTHEEVKRLILVICAGQSLEFFQAHKPQVKSMVDEARKNRP